MLSACRVERAATKLPPGSVVTLDQVLTDAPKLAQALAVEMTKCGMPKVRYQQHSKLAAIAEHNRKYPALNLVPGTEY
eukprot:SAG11_NODE_2561_length_3220_cov_1.882730_4_plen_78_part_00